MGRTQKEMSTGSKVVREANKQISHIRVMLCRDRGCSGYVAQPMESLRSLNWGKRPFQPDKLTALSSVGAIPGAIIRTHRCIPVLPTSEDGRLSHGRIIDLGLCKVPGNLQRCAGVWQLTAWARGTYSP